MTRKKLIDKPPTPNGHLRRLVRRIVIISLPFLAIATLYVATSYEFVPDAWRFVERRHPALDEVGTRAFTSAGIPGDPLNVAFVGSEASLQHMMRRRLQTGMRLTRLRSRVLCASPSIASRTSPTPTRQ
jgi:hypothetical protein